MIYRVLCILAFVFLPSVSQSASFSDKYDKYFSDYAAVFLPAGTDPLLLKAQCIQESRLNPLAESPVGAQGLCQFMPSTWRQVSAALDLKPGDVWLPEASIRAQAWYMGRLYRTWSAPRPNMDRYMLSAASYNAGAGNLIKAQRLCDGPTRYRRIIQCLPEVTGNNAHETIGYVHSIVTRWYPALLFDS